MHIHIRRSMLVLAFIVFLATAPIIVFYAIGYRPAGITQIPKAVGVALVNAFPRKATVEINGTSYGTLPKSIPNLTPGLTTIHVTKNGYQSWEKKLEIKPAQATDAREIRLIPSSPDQETIIDNATFFSVSSDEKFIASVDSKNRLSAYNQTTKTQTNSLLFAQGIANIVWSQDGGRMIIEPKDKKIAVVDLENDTLKKLSAKIPTGLTDISWSPSSQDSFFALTPTHDLIRYSIDNQTTEHIISDINTYTLYKNSILVQKNENTILQIEQRNLQIVSPLMNTEKRILEFIPSSQEDIALLLDDRELVLLKNRERIVPVASNVSSASWSPDGLLLLVQTSKEELNIYNAGNSRLKDTPVKELRLLVRLSSPITNPIWFSDSQHILYEHEGNIIFSEIDPRDHAIANTLTSISVKNPHIYIEHTGISLLHVQRKNGISGVERTWLVTKEDR